jgi:hypothetical protein
MIGRKIHAQTQINFKSLKSFGAGIAYEFWMSGPFIPPIKSKDCRINGCLHANLKRVWNELEKQFGEWYLKV